MRNNKSDFRPEVAHDAEALADNRSDISEKDVAFRLVGEQAHAYDPATEARVVRKCDWFFLPAMGLRETLDLYFGDKLKLETDFGQSGVSNSMTR